MMVAEQPPTDERRLAHLCLVAVLLFAGLSGAILYRFPPTVYGFYPGCPVHEYLHLACPGCGTTRALAALLHGHLAEALRWNALAVGIMLPLAAGYGVVTYFRAARGNYFRWPQPPAFAIYAGVAGIAAFTILRNL